MPAAFEKGRKVFHKGASTRSNVGGNRSPRPVTVFVILRGGAFDRETPDGRALPAEQPRHNIALRKQSSMSYFPTENKYQVPDERST
eukprot:768441-Hanusia_phi.AAC.6